MEDRLVIDTVNALLKKYNLVVRQICNNSDNTMEDLYQEAFCVVMEHFEEIEKDDRVFANKMKSTCLKFNKYGRRIESVDRWNMYNDREDTMKDSDLLVSCIDDDTICVMEDMKNLVGEEKLEFLLDYYAFGDSRLASIKGVSREVIRKRASNIIKFIKKNYKVG